MAETLLGIETTYNRSEIKALHGSTLAETLLGIETEQIMEKPYYTLFRSTLAETLLGIETTPRSKAISPLLFVPPWLKPF